jgi:hypothetical protein
MSAKEALDIDNWLETFGFGGHSFPDIGIRHTPRLYEFFVETCCLDVFLGTAASPQTAVLFASQGGGETARCALSTVVSAPAGTLHRRAPFDLTPTEEEVPPMAVISPAHIKFVGRREQIGLVEDCIGIVQYGGPVSRAVINFHGVVGIGKTALLRELQTRITSKRLPCAFIDFAEPQARTTLREVAADLTQDHKVPAVLFLDTLEKAEPGMLDWMEDEVIGPLIRTDRALVITASRIPHRWKQFEVRRRVYTAPLDRFDEPTTREQLPEEYSALTPKIMRLTYGHPFGNVYVLQYIQRIEEEVGRPFERADFDKYQTRLVQELAEQLIERVVMEGVSLDIKHAYRVMAVARHFDVNVLRRLLTRFVQDPFADKSAAYFLGVVGAMVKTTLVEWSSARRGYMLDDTIRWMLALHMRLTDRQKYEEINRELIGLYDEWIERVPENRSGFIIERLYHEACLESVQGADATDVADRLCGLLHGYLDRYYPVAVGGEMPHGRTVLTEELDKDDELTGFLPHDRTACLVEVVGKTSAMK